MIEDLLSLLEPSSYDAELTPAHLAKTRRLQQEAREALLSYQAKGKQATPEDDEILADKLKPVMDWYAELAGPAAVAKAGLEKLGVTSELN